MFERLEDLKQGIRFFASLPSKMLTIPSIGFLVTLWVYCLFAPDTFVQLPPLDAVVLSLATVCVAAVVDLAFVRARGILLFSARRVTRGSGLAAWALAFALVVLAFLLTAAIIRHYYLPGPLDRPTILVLDSARLPGDPNASNLASAIRRSLGSDRCAFDIPVLRAAVPVPALFGNSWVRHQTSRFQTGILVYGEPLHRPTVLCTTWKYGGPWLLPAPLYAEWPGEFRPSGGRQEPRRRFIWDVPYCQGIAVKTSDGSDLDLVDEVIWQSHILLSLNRAAKTDFLGAEAVAAHGAQEGRSRRLFRSIVSTYVAGLCWTAAAEAYSVRNPCWALQHFSSAADAFQQAVDLNTQVEIQMAEAATREPGFHELYNNGNMSWAKLLAYDVIPKRKEELESRCNN